METTNRNSIIYSLGILILISCHIKSDNNKVKVTTKSVANSEEILDNEYTRIVDSFCDTIYEHKHVKYNTEYFDLNRTKKTDCFVFSSGIECGGAMGSIGWIIEVFKKNNTSYKKSYTGFGLYLKVIQEEYQNIHSFMYQNKSGNLIKVDWDGKKFNEQTLLLSDTVNYKILKY